MHVTEYDTDNLHSDKLSVNGPDLVPHLEGNKNQTTLKSAINLAKKSMIESSTRSNVAEYIPLSPFVECLIPGEMPLSDGSDELKGMTGGGGLGSFIQSMFKGRFPPIILLKWGCETRVRTASTLLDNLFIVY